MKDNIVLSLNYSLIICSLLKAFKFMIIYLIFSSIESDFSIITDFRIFLNLLFPEPPFPNRGALYLHLICIDKVLIGH